MLTSVMGGVMQSHDTRFFCVLNSTGYFYSCSFSSLNVFHPLILLFAFLINFVFWSDFKRLIAFFLFSLFISIFFVLFICVLICVGGLYSPGAVAVKFDVTEQLTFVPFGKFWVLSYGKECHVSVSCISFKSVHLYYKRPHLYIKLIKHLG